jgi:hypothetical protein
MNLDEGYSVRNGASHFSPTHCYLALRLLHTCHRLCTARYMPIMVVLDHNLYTWALRTRPVEGQQIYADGFIDPPSGSWDPKKSPGPLVRTFLMKIRREDECIEKTHPGKILNGVRSYA